MGLLHIKFLGRVAGVPRLDPPVHASVGDDTPPILGFVMVVGRAAGNSISGAGLSSGAVLIGGTIGAL